MNTLTFTLSTANPTTPIKNTIQQKIDEYNAEKAKQDKAVSKRVHEMFAMRETILEQLNKEVGAEVWKIDSRKQNGYSSYHTRSHKKDSSKLPCFGVAIGFRDGVYKNTCFNDWDLIIQTPWSNEIKLADKYYRVPNLDVVEIYLVRTNKNMDYHAKEQISYKITDLSEVHKYLEKDYLTYFATSK